MKVNFAHLRELSTSGTYVDFAVFDANANSRSDSDRGRVLADLTLRARASGLKVDASALVFMENGQPRTYGDRFAIDYLSKRGIPRWTHSMEV